jgi:sialate O-acetylesterase
MNWSKPEFNDKDWESIFVPKEWENEGFPGYDGFAWYRRTFTAEDLKDRDNLYLRLGYIDDCNEVYINGKLIGHHGWFPPDFETAYQYDRIYYIHQEYLNPKGVNIIAVRVYDTQGPGGIVRGDIGFYAKNSFLSPQIDLAGIWKFKMGDEMEWKEVDVKDDNWNEVFVPALWSQYDLKEYDGFGWYRKEFKIPAQFKDERLILLLGKIDDMDEVYLNGEKIGHTGRMYSNVKRNDINNSDYIKDRAYTIPPSCLNEDGINVLAVRVFDGWLYGGIYDGPIGIVTRDRYVEWQRDYGSNKQFKNIFEMFFGE